jgi:hypothetical protein
MGPRRTEVVLRFDNTHHRPFQVPARLLGLPGWLRRLEKEDLKGLKAFAEGRQRRAAA